MTAPHEGAAVCSAKRHRTVSDYHNGGCRCPQAREAYRVYIKRHREGRAEPRRVDSTGTVRRIQALLAIGHTRAALAERLGVTEPAVTAILKWNGRVTTATAARYRDLYDRLSMTPGTSNRTRLYAGRQGWAPPLAWDEGAIDDPDAKPDLGKDRPDRTPDPVVVLRVVGGEAGLATRAADRLAVAAAMRAAGIADRITAKRLDVDVDSVRTLLRRHGVDRRAA